MFESDRRVDDAALPPLIVIGAAPITVNAVQETDPEHVAVVVEIDCTRPPEPTYARPCERDERRSGAEIVDEAVEKKPLNPRTVDVELYPVCTENGKANVLVRYPASLVHCEMFDEEKFAVVRPETVRAPAEFESPEPKRLLID